MAETQKQWSMKTDESPLDRDRSRSILVLRIGAALNALRADQRWYRYLEDAQGPAGTRDRIQAFVVALAHLGEAVKLWNAERVSIEALAGDGGANKELMKAVDLIFGTNGSLQSSLLKPVRDKAVFHWDALIFEQWATERPRGEAIVWFQGAGRTTGEVVASASLDAVSGFFRSLSSPSFRSDDIEAIRQRISEIVDAMGKVAELFELACHGFLKKYKVEITSESQGEP